MNQQAATVLVEVSAKVAGVAPAPAVVFVKVAGVAAALAAAFVKVAEVAAALAAAVAINLILKANMVINLTN